MFLGDLIGILLGAGVLFAGRALRNTAISVWIAYVPYFGDLKTFSLEMLVKAVGSGNA